MVTVSSISAAAQQPKLAPAFGTDLAANSGAPSAADTAVVAASAAMCPSISLYADAQDIALFGSELMTTCLR